MAPLRTHQPVDTGRKLNVDKTFRRRPVRLLKLLCTFSLRPVSTGHVYFTLKRCGNDRFHVVSTWNTRCVFRNTFMKSKSISNSVMIKE